MHSVETFWSGRYERAGHTGWNDPIIYAYDQLERLAFVESELAGVAEDSSALDFGCGSGDFSRLLLDSGYQVTGYDPFVSPPLSDPKFAFASSLDELAAPATGFDLILSVTVLDHVLDLRELASILSRLRTSLREGGRLMMVEYALDRDDTPASAYQAFRSLAEWQEILNGSGWKLADCRPVPHPEQAPSAGYRAFSRLLPVRAVRRVHHRLPLVERLMMPTLRKLARREFARFGLSRVETSPLKLMLCERGH